MTRFFVSSDDMIMAQILLTGENAAHAKVLRLKQGEQVLVCDGKGQECLCTVKSLQNGEVVLTVESRQASVSEANVKVSIYMAFPKADKLEYVIQKATELGCRYCKPASAYCCTAIFKPSSASAHRSDADGAPCSTYCKRTCS